MRVSDYKKSFKQILLIIWSSCRPSGRPAMKIFVFLFLWSIFGRHVSGSGSANPEQDMKMHWPAQARTLALETAVCFSSWPIFPAWPAPQLLWGLAQPTMSACFSCCCSEQLVFNFCGSARITIIDHLVQSSLFRLLWFGAACVSCCESDSCNCW